MPRKYTPITCSKTDFISLQSLAADPLNPRLALRARMILQCLEGKQIKEIAMELGERPNTVILWKNRFLRLGNPRTFQSPSGQKRKPLWQDFSRENPPAFKYRSPGWLTQMDRTPPLKIYRCPARRYMAVSPQRRDFPC